MPVLKEFCCQVIYSQFGLAIHQNDHQARSRFVEWAQNEIAVVPDFHKRILFSDEAHFWLNGYVNKQNCRIWSKANPQVYVETPLHPEKLTVWQHSPSYRRYTATNVGKSHRKLDVQIGLHPSQPWLTTRTVDAEDRVLQELERNPSTSRRVVSRETHIPQATVWHIAHDEGLHPYHLQRVQALELGDYNKRMDFARWFLHESNADRNFAASVLFTDEATFSLEGMMNFHNLHTWADENPHAIRPHGAQRKCSRNVWAGIVGDCLFGPYILPERLNGSVYLTFLQEVLPEMLNDVPMPIRQRIRFQHDGAPAHFSIDVRAHLQATFPGGWIGRGGPIAWPARSSDLSPLDFFLWGFLEGLLYETPVATPEDLVGRIVEAAGWVQILLVLLRRCAVPCNVDAGRVSMLLEKTLSICCKLDISRM
ncbi:transposable element Tcb1 transposase [Trichonephila clavipes]|uniref:Transposable element Tcb1 transposase n=1 Tax=Trichonephila clavipes TaxID=2585209 RepID=A0A8X6SN00_TRICX|nr:transposable element Tcb1 transposase [Trichonephila clavipes]